MLEYEGSVKQIDAHGSLAECKLAKLVINTDVTGCADAFNPVELLLASVAACILKNMEPFIIPLHQVQG